MTGTTPSSLALIRSSCQSENRLPKSARELNSPLLCQSIQILTGTALSGACVGQFKASRSTRHLAFPNFQRVLRPLPREHCSAPASVISQAQ
jgi:hypothetical protein